MTTLTRLIDGVPSLLMLCVEQLCLRVVSELDQLEEEVESRVGSTAAMVVRIIDLSMGKVLRNGGRSRRDQWPQAVAGRSRHQQTAQPRCGHSDRYRCGGW